MELSERLSAVAETVRPAGSLADIGTDHAYLPIALVGNGTVGRAFALDVKKGPLSRAEKNVRAAGLSDRVGTVLSDGLTKLPEPCDCLVFAGMGGRLIAELLSSREGAAPSSLAAASQLVLQPQSEPETVRRALRELGFRTESERMVRDRGKFYLVISAVPGESEAREEELLFGTLMGGQDPVFREYLLEEREKNARILKKLEKNAGASSGARVRELEEYLSRIEKELAKW